MGKSLPQGGRSLEELKRVSRILEIVQLISASPRRYLRRDLAERYELSERMLQKDLEVIREGLCLSLRHSRQGYYFEDVPRLPALQYTFSEALSLLLAVQAARQVSGINSSELGAAVARLESLFPSEFDTALQKMLTPPVLTVERARRQEMLKLLHKALLEQRKVKMVYETGSRGGAISERVVCPYHLMPYVRSWQLIAYCQLRKNVRMFKVARIHKATLLGERYTVPADFELEEYLGRTWGLLRGEADEAEDIVLHFDTQAGRWVVEETWHSTQKVEKQEDGTVILHLHVAVTPEFVNWLLYYGKRVRVLQPATLREQVVREHRLAAEANEMGSCEEGG